MSKKGFTLIELLAVISILALIAMVVFPAVNSLIKKAKEDAYNEQVAIIEKAAKEWALDNTDKLPEMVEGSNTSVPVDELLISGYISESDVKDPRDKTKNLKGSVIIIYTSNQYTYQYDPNTSSTIGNWLLENANDKTTLKANNGIYKGSSANNYLTYAEKTWRILSINSNGTIKAVMSESVTSLPFDSNGSSNFEKSSIYTYLNSTFLNTLDTSKLAKSNFCTGDINSPCGNTVIATIGLLSINDYVNASNEQGCSSQSALCNEGTYLTNLSNTCLTNEKSGQVYVVNSGNITLKSPTEDCNIMPVITLNSDITLSGSGTSDNPFVVN